MEWRAGLLAPGDASASKHQPMSGALGCILVIWPGCRVIYRALEGFATLIRSS